MLYIKAVLHAASATAGPNYCHYGGTTSRRYTGAKKTHYTAVYKTTTTVFILRYALHLFYHRVLILYTPAKNNNASFERVTRLLLLPHYMIELNHRPLKKHTFNHMWFNGCRFSLWTWQQRMEKEVILAWTVDIFRPPDGPHGARFSGPVEAGPGRGVTGGETVLSPWMDLWDSLDTGDVNPVGQWQMINR